MRNRGDMRPTLLWTQDVMAPASALIIDPVLSDVMFSVAAASSLGFRVTVADSFQEALERLRVPPALLIAHIRLGEYNGLHLVLRGKAARRDLAAIVTSGVADQVLHIPPRSGEKMVDAENDCPIPEQALAKMGAEKAGTAGDQDAVLEMHGPQPPLGARPIELA